MLRCGKRILTGDIDFFLYKQSATPIILTGFQYFLFIFRNE